MTGRSFMLIAGETSGDILAAELVNALRARPDRGTVPPRFFGAGGPRMAAAGVELAFDLTAHSVIGLWEAVRRYRTFRDLLDRLLDLALDRQPDVIVCVDFSGFNRRFAQALRARQRRGRGPFHNWHPRLVQYVSPQVWASRPGRARAMARDFDLLLSIFPFEPAWYAANAPGLKVVFVGHPIIDRHAANPAPPWPDVGTRLTSSIVFAGPEEPEPPASKPVLRAGGTGSGATQVPRRLVLLPGSRVGELARHLPVMLGAWAKLRAEIPGLTGTMVLPDTKLLELARTFPPPADVVLQCGGLAESLATADLAIASTGTVTLECACFGVPTIALYRTSWITYQIGRRLVTVKFLSMPNLLAGVSIYPEFVQDAATPDAIAGAATELLTDSERVAQMKRQLREVIAKLGAPGASQRAAEAVDNLD